MSDQLTDTSLDPEINSSPVDLSRALYPGGEGYIKRKMQVYVCVCVCVCSVTSVVSNSLRPYRL